MADIAIFRINYKSDFILTLNSDAGWLTPFCIKFWTGAPSQAYYAYYDGMSYTHCAPVDGEPTKLLVQFDDHHLPIGDLKLQIGYHFTVDDFPTTVEDEVLNQASVIIEQDGEPAQVMLDFNGETAPEIEFSLPAYANEAQRITNEQARIEAEQQRIANEDARIQAEETRQQNEQQRIAHETNRINEFATLKSQSQAATSAANAAATLANEKAQLAADKAALAQQKAEYAQQQGGYAKDQGDYAKNQGNYAKEQGEIAQADHERAEADHGIAADDHTQAGNDHTRAESDHTRAESDHAAVEVYVDSLGAFDISAYNATGGVLAKYADLTAALGTNGANIPEAIRKGGMSVKFVLSSDNNYVQFRYMSSSTTNANFTNVANWQGIDEEPTQESHNLVKSGGVAKYLPKNTVNARATYGVTNGAMRITNGVTAYSSTDVDYRVVGLTTPVHLNKGDLVIIGNGITKVYIGAWASVFAEVIESGGETSYQNLLTGAGFAIYKYIADRDMNIVVTTTSVAAVTVNSVAHPANDAEVVKTVEQSLTNAQKAQALANVGITGIDADPVFSSTNIVTSGGVFKFLAEETKPLSKTHIAGAMRITNGVVAFSASDTYATYGYDTPIHLNKGECLIVKDGNRFYANTWASVLTEVVVQDNNTSYICLIQGQGATTTCVYTAPRDMDVIVCSSSQVSISKRSLVKAEPAEDTDPIYTNTVAPTSGRGWFNTISLPEGLYRFEFDVTGTLQEGVIIPYHNNYYTPLRYLFSDKSVLYIPVYASDAANTVTFRINYQFSSEDNEVTLNIYKKKFDISIVDPLNFLSYSKPLLSTLKIQWYQGYPTSPFTRTNVSYWCSSNVQFNRGKKLKFTFSSDYYVTITGFNYNASTGAFVNVDSGSVTSGTVYDTTNWFIWAIQVRRTAYGALSPSEILSILTIDDMGGELWSKEITTSDVEKFTTNYDNAISAINTSIQALETGVQRNRLGTLTIGKWLHHLNVESSYSLIPSQSLFDIAYAKALGFKMIEANLHTCSDGVTVIKHGDAGKLGDGLLFASGSGIDADTLFSDITSTELRNSVTYSSSLAKYQGHIPTLDEFCAECAKLGIIAFLRGCNSSQLAIARKYLPDERIIVEGLAQRGDFNGYMTVYANDETAQNILNACNTKGQPFYYAWSAATSASDELFTEVAQTLHSNGYHLAAAYVNPNSIQNLTKKGLDIIASIHGAIPPFEDGNYLNIVNCGDSHLTMTDATYDSTTDTTSIQNGGTIILSDSTAGASLAKVSIRIRYNGTLTIQFGQISNIYRDLSSYESDGTSDMELACACPRYGESPFVKIIADSATTIYDLKIALSVISI